ncbi:MAG: HlyD family type I secretion periplasmic adaptor subunit, partial [Chitinivibrionales bacterium]|nr:HlyD family type I secretion periplasmic adaptor subunit [Chitinivibrionales bacterium]MBD3359027.1 HlyD family type I secretion periplasmic adaptor subunit [Chitinivibrionales bacterium]
MQTKNTTNQISSSTAFQHDLLPSFTFSSPRVLIAAGMTILLVFFGGLGTLSAIAEVTGAVIAGGEVKVESERKIVQHLEGGIVKEIRVRDGDRVKRGVPLIILEGTRIVASCKRLRKQLNAKLALQARLTAEMNVLATIAWPHELLSQADSSQIRELISCEKKIFYSRRKALQGQVELYNARIQQIVQKIDGLKRQLQAEETIYGTLKEELSAKEKLYDKRYIEKSHVLELRRKVAVSDGKRGMYVGSLAEAREKIAELK